MVSLPIALDSCSVRQCSRGLIEAEEYWERLVSRVFISTPNYLLIIHASPFSGRIPKGTTAISGFLKWRVASRRGSRSIQAPTMVLFGLLLATRSLSLENTI